MIHEISLGGSSVTGSSLQFSLDRDASGAWRRPWGRRLAVGHLAFELAQPAVGSSEYLGGAALVAAVLGDGSAGHGPFHVIQETGQGTAVLQCFQECTPLDAIEQFCNIEGRCSLRSNKIGRASCRERV